MHQQQQQMPPMYGAGPRPARPIAGAPLKPLRPAPMPGPQMPPAPMRGPAPPPAVKPQPMVAAVVEPRYAQMRRDAVVTSRALDERQQEYLQERRRVVQQMDAEFEVQNAELADRRDDLEMQLRHIKEQGRCELRRLERAILADRSLRPEERDRRLVELHRHFRARYEPDDEYARQVHESGIGGLLAAMLGPMMSFGGGGGGGMPCGGMMMGAPRITFVSSRGSGLGAAAPSPRPSSSVQIEEVESPDTRH